MASFRNEMWRAILSLVFLPTECGIQVDGVCFTKVGMVSGARIERFGPRWEGGVSVLAQHPICTVSVLVLVSARDCVDSS